MGLKMHIRHIHYLETQRKYFCLYCDTQLSLPNKDAHFSSVHPGLEPKITGYDPYKKIQLTDKFWIKEYGLCKFGYIDELSEEQARQLRSEVERSERKPRNRKRYLSSDEEVDSDEPGTAPRTRESEREIGESHLVTRFAVGMHSGGGKVSPASGEKVTARGASLPPVKISPKQHSPQAGPGGSVSSPFNFAQYGNNVYDIDGELFYFKRYVANAKKVELVNSQGNRQCLIEENVFKQIAMNVAHASGETRPEDPVLPERTVVSTSSLSNSNIVSPGKSNISDMYSSTTVVCAGNTNIGDNMYGTTVTAGKSTIGDMYSNTLVSIGNMSNMYGSLSNVSPGDSSSGITRSQDRSFEWTMSDTDTPSGGGVDNSVQLVGMSPIKTIVRTRPSILSKTPSKASYAPSVLSNPSISNMHSTAPSILSTAPSILSNAPSILFSAPSKLSTPNPSIVSVSERLQSISSENKGLGRLLIPSLEVGHLTVPSLRTKHATPYITMVGRQSTTPTKSQNENIEVVNVMNVMMDSEDRADKVLPRQRVRVKILKW
ncbi:uncharacterized protein LOC103506160 [Diaphorina citri]|uniref:Uncharacterized protein LOC103506160 n=1 Tax=Diaphorina citri TaxID=121845 RepID=A0A1S3CVU9_DIACI|nr:uncharacterized protein LOC103506160 [Diaphorina citri]